MCKILSKKLGINIEVFGDKKLKKMGMNTLLSVSKGSKFGGYMVKMEINKGKSIIEIVIKLLNASSSITTIVI